MNDTNAEKNEPYTIAFYADTDTKSLLESWAKLEDRSVSSVIRRLIEAEKQRRATSLPLVNLQALG